MTAKTRTIKVGGWDGSWDSDDPDANFKADVALYSHVDAMATIGRLAAAMNIPEGAWSTTSWPSGRRPVAAGSLSSGRRWSTGSGLRSSKPNGPGPTLPGWRHTTSSVKCWPGCDFPSWRKDQLPGTDRHLGNESPQTLPPNKANIRRIETMKDSATRDGHGPLAPRHDDPSTVRACIIGAGSSGIAAAKALQERSIAFDCFDKSSFIGGLWAADSPGSGAYRTLHINSYRKDMQYAEYHVSPGSARLSPPRTIYQYFNDYVDKFDLRSHVSAMCSLLGSSNPGARSCPSQRRNPSWWLTIFAARTLCPQEPRCFPRSSDKMRNWPDAMSAPSATPYRLTSPSTCTDYKCSALPARAGRTGKAAMPARRRLANEGAKCLAGPGGRTRRILAPISAGSFQVTDEVPAGITRALPPQ